MQSLFILSLPRSLSTQVHRLACTALELRSPAWTSAGEILNPDRTVLAAETGGAKYTTPRQADLFGPAQDFLSQVVAAKGFAYKDVVQPFVAARWLRDHPRIRVLKIRPNVAHVACAMLGRRWLYPTVAAPGGASLEHRMVAGLMRAAQAIDEVPGEVVAYDDLVEGFEPLRAALGRLYPSKVVGAMVKEPGFEADRAAVLERRSGALYTDLQAMAQQFQRVEIAA